MSKKMWIVVAIVLVLAAIILVLYSTTDIFKKMWEGIIWLLDYFRGGQPQEAI